LKRMTGLEYLDLDGTRITDAGLVYLKRASKLKHLRLMGTRVSNAGVKDLGKALLLVKIEH
jgi:Leucine Rich repeat